MSPLWLGILAFIYFAIAAIAVFVLYKLYKTFTQGRRLGFNTMPKLTQVTSKNLPKEFTTKLEAINQKAEKLLGYYGSGQIKDKGIVGENEFLVKKILDVHLPEAIADYQRLDNTRANQMAVGATGKTARALLSEYLDTINGQFDEMLDAMYEQNAQKLLVTNRYLQSRFEQENALQLTHVSQADGVVPPPAISAPDTVNATISPAIAPTTDTKQSLDK